MYVIRVQGGVVIKMYPTISQDACNDTKPKCMVVKWQTRVEYDLYILFRLCKRFNIKYVGHRSHTNILQYINNQYNVYNTTGSAI